MNWILVIVLGSGANIQQPYASELLCKSRQVEIRDQIQQTENWLQEWNRGTLPLVAMVAERNSNGKIELNPKIVHTPSRFQDRDVFRQELNKKYPKATPDQRTYESIQNVSCIKT